MFLTETEVLREIVEYVQEDYYAYALMLDGGWGCGKTFFLQTQVIPEVEKIEQEDGTSRSTIYISLYGLKTKEEITVAIYVSYLQNKTGLKDRAISLGLSFIPVILKSKGIEGVPLEKIADLFAKFRGCVLIMDDLERCSMHINEVLGVISSLVEQYRLKVIIVANESEIGLMDEIENKEIKYLISTKEDIEYPEKNNRGESLQTKKGEKAGLTCLKARAHYLFDENELYKRAKEKVIGRTIRFRPDIRKAAGEIITKHARCPYIIGKKDLIINGIAEIYERCNYQNIRTLQFALNFCDRVLELVLKSRSYDDDIEKLIEVLMNAILLTSIKYKNGEPPFEWNEEKEYGLRYYERGFGMMGYVMSFRFVQEYVYYSSYSDARIISAIEDYITQQKADEYEPMRLLSYYWEMEDKDVERILSEVTGRLYGYKYDASDYPQILILMQKIISVGFEVNLEQVFDFMRRDIEEHGSKGGSLGQFGDGPEVPTIEIKEKISELKRLNRHTRKVGLVSELDATIRSVDGWGKEFSQLLFDRNNQIYIEGGLLKLIDIEKLIEVLDNSKTQDFSDFRRATASFYESSSVADMCKGDAENANALLEHMRKKKYDQKTKELNRSLIVEMLQDVIKRLNR